jgi:acetyl-CoA synthetase
MKWPILIKDRDLGGPAPNLADYESAYRSFTWDAARADLDGLPGERGLNIAYEAVNRHALGERRNRVALRFLSRSAPPTELSYGDLNLQTNRFANVLGKLGLRKGDRVFTLLGRIPELYVTCLGALKAGCVFSPLFSAFGPDPIRQRITLGDARVLVTTAALYRRRVAAIRDELHGLTHVLLVDVGVGVALPPGCMSFHELSSDAAEEFEIPPTAPEDMALLHFTSGTTGTPKGAIHVHEAVVAHHSTGSLALDLHAEDVFWCTADPGWVTGTSYGIISPLTHGLTTIVDEEEFDPLRWYSILQDEQVTVWYTAPTALRMLMKAGAEIVKDFDLSHLRFIASVGEPLNPQVVMWGKEVLGLPIHDNWWQTETGGIMIANFAAMDVRPGSMGRPLPGIEAAIAARDPVGEVVLSGGVLEFIDSPGREGELVLRAGWPSMFRGYLHQQERYEHCFVAGWYLSGDLVKRDADGYYFFVGRGDDVIKSAGHLIGPFEVESAFMEHPAVVEVGVIGMPDPVVGEIVKAFVTLRPGYQATEDLRLELLGWGRKRLGAAVAPKEIAFSEHLPHTSSGKIMRRLLKARELGLAEGDISTLEEQR